MSIGKPFLLLLVLLSPGASHGQSGEPDPVRIVDLIDRRLPVADTVQGAWEYQRTLDADLDGDGVDERVLLMANVYVPGGQPVWDDGQPWEVRIDGSTGEQTRVYAQYVQLGTLKAGIKRGEGGARLVLLEVTGVRVRVFEIHYEGPGRTQSRELADEGVDWWI